MQEQISNGKALEKLKQLVEKQGGDSSYINNTEKFPKASYILPVIAQKDGYVVNLDAKKVGEISMELGAGRNKKEDTIDSSVGVVLEKKIGNEVKTGDILGFIHANNENLAKQTQEKLLQVYQIENEKKEKKNILEIIV